MTAVVKKLCLLPILALVIQGCSTTYVPVSWGLGKRPLELSRSDQTLSILFDHYDPQRETLRITGQSFEEVMVPSEVQKHLGAYRPDTKQIYRNLYHDYSDLELRDILVHELSHHVWSNIKEAQRYQWKEYLKHNPTPLQEMVRATYNRPGDWDTEDFAYVMEFPRFTDIKELAKIGILNDAECQKILEKLPQLKHGVVVQLPSPSPSATAKAAPPKTPSQAAGIESDDVK